MPRLGDGAAKAGSASMAFQVHSGHLGAICEFNSVTSSLIARRRFSRYSASRSNPSRLSVSVCMILRPALSRSGPLPGGSGIGKSGWLSGRSEFEDTLQSFLCWSARHRARTGSGLFGTAMRKSACAAAGVISPAGLDRGIVSPLASVWRSRSNIGETINFMGGGSLLVGAVDARRPFGTSGIERTNVRRASAFPVIAVARCAFVVAFAEVEGFAIGAGSARLASRSGPGLVRPSGARDRRLASPPDPPKAGAGDGFPSKHVRLDLAHLKNPARKALINRAAASA